MNNTKKSFKPGQVVVFDDDSVINISEEYAIKYYTCLGYKLTKKPLFVFLCEILDGEYDSGHCVLLELGTNKIESMRHTSNFRLATDDEF